MSPVRSGIGFDVHRLVAGRRLVLGGVAIPYERGLAGHSDGDVVLHAIADAILGAAALGDIGTHFPDDDPAWEGADSIRLLNRVRELAAGAGWRVGNVDVTVLAESPRIAPHGPAMRAAIATALRIDVAAASVKATTMEAMGFVGRGEGIGALAVATLAAGPEP